LEWLKQCPHLTHLHWAPIGAFLPSDVVAELQQEVWEHLEDLSMEELYGDIKELHIMLTLLPPLRRFRLQSYMFDILAFDALRDQLFDSIKILDMSGTLGFKSWMALEVMDRCVHLEEFKTVLIQADGLWSRPTWVCLGLRRLEAPFVVEEYISGILAFEAIARLTNLEHLDFSVDETFQLGLRRSSCTNNDTFQWNLDCGLDRLTTLKKLKSVLFWGTRQNMVEQDLEWMFENWPALEVLGGEGERRATFSDDEDTNRRLEQLITQRGIRYH